MKQDSVNYFRVGLFVLGMLFVLFYSLYKITGSNEATDTYYVELENVTGLRNGSTVTYSGFEMGKVVDVKPKRINGKTIFIIEFSVQSGWPVPIGSSAQIVSPSLLTDRQLNITESGQTELYAVNSMLIGVEAVDVMQLAEDFSTQLQIFSEQGLQPLISTINNQITAVVPKITGQTEELLSQLNTTATQINKLLDVADPEKIEGMVNNTEQLIHNMLNVSENLNNSMKNIDGLVEAIGHDMSMNNEDIKVAISSLRSTLDVVSENINSIVYNLDATTRNMQEFTRQLRDNPGALLNSQPPEEKVE